MKHAKKHVKRFASLLLALVMVLSMSLSAFASSAGTEPAATGSITLDNTTSGETYNIYQIWDKDNKANTDWMSFLSSADISDTYVTLNGNTVAWVENADYAAFAALALAYAQSDAEGRKPGEEGYTSPQITPTATQIAEAETVAFSGLGFGAYLVDASNTLYVLNETDPNAEIKFGTVTIKNARPAETYDLYRILDLVSYDTTGATPNLETGNLEGGKYSYKLNPDWIGFIEYSYTTDTGNVIKVSDYLNYQTITVPGTSEKEGEKAKDVEQKTDMVVWINGTNKDTYSGFAKLALKYAKEHGLKPVASHTIDGKAGDPNVAYTFTDLPLGWYLVDTSLGSLCSLDTTNPNVYIQEKNDVPTNTKQVKEDSGQDAWQDHNDADVGQEVEFRSIVSVKNGTDKILFHDKMSEGLTFLYNAEKEWDNAGEADGTTKPEGKEDNLKVSFSPKTATDYKTLVQGTDYNVVVDPTVTDSETGEEVSEGCTFHIEFTDKFYQLIGAGNHDVLITYKAILNEKAVIGKVDDVTGTLVGNIAGNTNTSKVTYGDNNNSTPDSKTTTRTYEVPVYKYAGDGTERTGLSDTHFTIRRDENGSKPLKLVLVDDGIKEKTNSDGTPETDEAGNQVKEYTQAVYRVATQDEINKVQTAANPEPDKVKIVTEIVTNESGKFKIQGLDRSNYLLEETQAKDGYNILKQPVKIVIEEVKETKQMVNAEGEPLLDDEGNPKMETITKVVIKQNATAVTEIGIQNKSGSEMPETGGIGTTIFYVLGSILLVGAAILLITKRRMSAEK